MSKIVPRENPCYCINFRRVTTALTKYYDKAFVPFGVTTSQFSLLCDINILKTCNKSELAQFTKLDRTTIIRNLRGLAEKGLIEETDEGKKIQLTQKGEQTVIEGKVAWEAVQKQIREVIGKEHIPLLKEILYQLEHLE